MTGGFNPKEQKKVSQKERGSCLSRGYKISNTFLGGGAVGRVFLAEATEVIIASNPKMKMISQHGQPLKVAIKIIYADTGAHNIRKLAKYTPSEIGNMNRAYGHPNILMLFDVFIACKRIFIVTELAGQGSLKRLYRTNYISNKAKPFMTECEARYYFRETARGVTELHSQSIAHRDLKLDNVLITETGEVKLGDFGFSIRLSFCNLVNQNSAEAVKDIANTTLCGTPCFMAPEVLRNRGAYNAISADLWSLGVILYILVNGYYPYPGKNIQEVLHSAEKFRNKDLPFRDHISNECKDLITKLLRFDAWKRPSAFTILQHPWLLGKMTTPDNFAANANHFQEEEFLEIRLDPVVSFQEKYVRSYLLQRSEIINVMLKRITALNTVPKSIISEFGVRLAIPRRYGSDDCIIKEVWRLMAPSAVKVKDPKETSIDTDKVLQPSYGLPWKSSWADGACNSTIAVLPARRIIYELSILDKWRKVRQVNDPPLTELEKCIQLRNTVDLDEQEPWPLENSVPRPTAEWATVGENWGAACFPRLLNETEWDGAKLSIQPLQDAIVDQSNIVVRYVPIEQPSNALECFLQQMSAKKSHPLSNDSNNKFDSTKESFNSSFLTLDSSPGDSKQGPYKAPVAKKMRLPDNSSHKVLEKIKKRREMEEQRRRTLPSCAFYTPRGVKPTAKPKYEMAALDLSHALHRNEAGSTKIPSPRETWLHKKYPATRACFTEAPLQNCLSDKSLCTTERAPHEEMCSKSHIVQQNIEQHHEEYKRKICTDRRQSTNIPSSLANIPTGTKRKSKTILKKIDLSKVRRRPNFGPTKIPFLRAPLHCSKEEEYLTNNDEVLTNRCSDSLTNVSSLSDEGVAKSFTKKLPVKIKPPLIRFKKIRRVKSEIPNPVKKMDNKNNVTRQSVSCNAGDLLKEDIKQPSLFRRFTHKLLKMVPAKRMLKIRKANYKRTHSQSNISQCEVSSTTNSSISKNRSFNFTNASIAPHDSNITSHTSNAPCIHQTLSLSSSSSSKNPTENQSEIQSPEQKKKFFQSSNFRGEVANLDNAVEQRNLEHHLSCELAATNNSNLSRPCAPKSNKNVDGIDHKTEKVTDICDASGSKISSNAPCCSYSTTMENASQAKTTHSKVSMRASESKYIAFTKDKPNDDFSSLEQSLSWVALLDNHVDRNWNQTTGNESSKRINAALSDAAIGSSLDSKDVEDYSSPIQFIKASESDDNDIIIVNGNRKRLDKFSATTTIPRTNESFYHTPGAIGQRKADFDASRKPSEKDENRNKQNNDEEKDFKWIESCYFEPTKINEDNSKSFSLSFEDYLNAVNQQSSVSMQTSANQVSADEKRYSTDLEHRTDVGQVENAKNDSGSHRIVCEKSDESTQSVETNKHKIEQNSELRQIRTGIAKPTVDLTHRCMSWLTLSDTSTFAGSFCEEQRRRAKEKYGLGEDSIAFLCNEKINNDWLLDLSISNETRSLILSHQSSALAQAERLPNPCLLKNIANADRKTLLLPGKLPSGSDEQEKVSAASSSKSNSETADEVVISMVKADSFFLPDTAADNNLSESDGEVAPCAMKKDNQRFTSPTDMEIVNKSKEVKTKECSPFTPLAHDTSLSNTNKAYNEKVTLSCISDQQRVPLHSHNSSLSAPTSFPKDNKKYIAEQCEAEVEEYKNDDTGFMGLLKIRSELKALEEKWNKSFASVCKQSRTENPESLLKFLKENDHLPSESTAKENTDNSSQISQKILAHDSRENEKEKPSPSSVTVSYNMWSENAKEKRNANKNLLKNIDSSAAVIWKQREGHEIFDPKLKPKIKSIFDQIQADALQEADKKSSISRIAAVPSRNVATKASVKISSNNSSNQRKKESFDNRDTSQWQALDNKAQHMSSTKRKLNADESNYSKLSHPKNVVINECATLKDDIQDKVYTVELLAEESSERTGRLASKKHKEPHRRTCKVKEQCSHLSNEVCAVMPNKNDKNSRIHLNGEKCVNEATSAEIQSRKSTLKKILPVENLHAVRQRNSTEDIAYNDAQQATSKKQRVSFMSTPDTQHSYSNSVEKTSDKKQVKKMKKIEHKRSVPVIHKQILPKSHRLQQTNMASEVLDRPLNPKNSNNEQILNVEKRPNLIQKMKDVCVTSFEKSENSQKISSSLEKLENEKILKHPKAIFQERSSTNRKTIGRKIQHVRQEVDNKIKKMVTSSNDKLRGIRTCSKCKKLESSRLPKSSSHSTEDIPPSETVVLEGSKTTLIDIILALLRREMAQRSSLSNLQSGEGAQPQKDNELEWFKTCLEQCVSRDPRPKPMLSKSVQTDRSFLQGEMSQEVPECSLQPDNQISHNLPGNVVITTSKTPTGISIDINAAFPDEIIVTSGNDKVGQSVGGNKLVSSTKKKSLPKTIKTAMKTFNPFSSKASAQFLDNGDFFPLPLSSSSRQAYADIDSDEPVSDSGSSTVTLHRSKSFLESRITKLVSFVHKVKRVRKYFVTKYGRGRVHRPDAPQRSSSTAQPTIKDGRDSILIGGDDEEDEESEESISEYLFQIPEYLLEMPDLNFNCTESFQ